ncbi:MAG TPA: FAD-dependent oxidoreductase [Pyrinomonadaceae bacterium]|nr:FAD-dependent oxidoreductase [Pyrinomonadaceae bacterium]
MANSTYDVAVIGAGVFGAWTAYQLQRTGMRVVLIDAHGPGNSRSSSGGESRIIRMGYGADEIYARSAQRSLRLWQELFARIDQRLFHRTGVLWLAQENDPYPVKTAETLSRLGISFEKLTTAEVRHRYPQIGLDGISWALLEPDSGVLLARQAVQGVHFAAVKTGVDYLQEKVSGTGVPPVIPAQGERKLDQIVTASGQRISAAHFVFACGPWLPKIFPALLADRIHSTRQEVFFFGAPAGDPRFTQPALPTWIDFKDEAYGLPDLEGRGLKIAIDRHGPEFDPDSGDRMPTSEGLGEVRQYLARRLPDLKDAPVTETRVCQYENTSNGDFLIDLHPDFENVWLVGGGSGHGFKHGPVVGEYVAARITGSIDGIEPRFSLETKARERNRAVF